MKAKDKELNDQDRNKLLSQSVEITYDDVVECVKVGLYVYRIRVSPIWIHNIPMTDLKLVKYFVSVMLMRGDKICRVSIRIGCSNCVLG